MDSLQRALRPATPGAVPPAARADVLLVVGGGGMLGAALLARALGCGRFARVQALVATDLASAFPGFEPLPAACLSGAMAADTAVIVFERAWRNNGRDEAFVRPQPDQLPLLAAQLRQGGVRRLLVLTPHAPVLLPQALKAGLASLDEGRVAAMGFEQLVFMRSAQAAPRLADGGGWAARLGAAWWSQLRWMLPQGELPVRTERLAELAMELAWRLAEAAPATRVLAPDVLRQAAVAEDSGAVLAAWLAGDPLPSISAPVRRW